MEANIIGFLLLMGAAATLGGVFISVNSLLGPNGLLGPKTPVSPLKFESFDCGNIVDEDARINFSVKFYVVGILFLIFDMETIFMALLVPQFVRLGTWLPLIAMLMFSVTLVVGFLYILKKGGLEWK